MITFWLISNLAKTLLAGLVLHRRAWRTYPGFTTYCWFCCITSWVNFATWHLAPAWYRTSFGAQALLHVPVAIFLIAAVFAKIFKPYSTLPPATLRYYAGMVLLVVVVAISIAIYHPVHDGVLIVNLIRTFERSVSVLLFASFGLISLFSRYLGIPWRHRLFGIGVGFLLSTGVDAVATSALAGFGSHIISYVRFARMTTYFLAVCIWAWYFWRPDTQPIIVSLEELKWLSDAMTKLAKRFERDRHNILWIDEES